MSASFVKNIYSIYSSINTLFCSECSVFVVEYLLSKSTVIITELLRYGSANVIQSTNQHLGSPENIAILGFRTHWKGPYICSQNAHIYRTPTSAEQDLEIPNRNEMNQKVQGLERSTFTYLHAYIDIKTNKKKKKKKTPWS
jgi:hypothetical protein